MGCVIVPSRATDLNFSENTYLIRNIHVFLISWSEMAEQDKGITFLWGVTGYKLSSASVLHCWSTYPPPNVGLIKALFLLGVYVARGLYMGFSLLTGMILQVGNDHISHLRKRNIISSKSAGWRGRWASFEEGSLGTCHENVFFVHVFFLCPHKSLSNPIPRDGILKRCKRLAASLIWVVVWHVFLLWTPIPGQMIQVDYFFGWVVLPATSYTIYIYHLFKAPFWRFLLHYYKDLTAKVSAKGYAKDQLPSISSTAKVCVKAKRDRSTAGWQWPLLTRVLGYPSLKLAKTPENGGVEDKPFFFWVVFFGREVLYGRFM